MPRAAGQIDRAKNEAIIEAASDVIYERGLTAPLDEIARRAGVSKQTIYNHYGSKAALVAALIDRRTEQITTSLDVAGPFPQEALTAYAAALLRVATIDRGIALFRLLIESVPNHPDLARAVMPRGVRSSRMKLAAFLERESRAGRLAIPDPVEAADFFAGMVISHRQIQSLLGLSEALSPERIERIASEATRRFMRAYAP